MAGNDRAKRMGRPRRRDRDAALDAAIELIHRDGVANASVEDLLTAMDLSRSSFYDAFGSKHGLLLAALQRYADSGREALRAIVAGDDPAPERLRRAVHYIANVDDPRGCLLVVSMVEMSDRDVDVAEILRRHSGEVEAILQPLVGDDAAAARAYVAAAYGATVMRRVGSPTAAVRSTLDALLSRRATEPNPQA